MSHRPPARTGPATRALALAALLGATLLGCGSDAGSGGAPGGTATGSDAPIVGASTEPAATGAPAAQRIEQVNETMRGTPFSGIGTTTAFEGAGLQRIVWNPDQGLRISYTGTAGGDMYCKDGVTYMSTGLLAESFRTRGTGITVPERLADVYVTTRSGQGCDAYFAVPPSGTFAQEKDTTVEGVPARAIVASAGPTSDTYFVSAKNPARLLKMKSVRDGRTSSTTYVDFGTKKDVTLPSPDKTMTMEQFRAQVDAG
ncbi:hypothetical protein [Streptomyces sp. NK08204]|uniref:hypothetical protein n=1 Tax=Streptomyces sp. NK08204 TaxID=2873260 RepID=UPI001CEC40B5|nr:hypothetical protein [Streptomyces sp. NK08204]